jgi:tetratricopeptide (TPR) repeat protein
MPARTAERRFLEGNLMQTSYRPLPAASIALVLAALCVPAAAEDDPQSLWTQYHNDCEQWLADGQYPQAEAACKNAAAAGERLEPGLPLDTSLNALALVYLYQNRHADAEQSIRHLLESRAKNFGPWHPLTAAGMNLLAVLYRKTGRAAEAEQLDVKAQEIRETCETQLGDETREQITEGAFLNFCNPRPVPGSLE